MPQNSCGTECKSGASALYYQQTPFITPTATVSYTRPSGVSADTKLNGSFCPLISGYYRLEFIGVADSRYSHYSYFMKKKYELPNTLQNQYLEKGMCYSFVVYSCNLEYSYCTFKVQLNGNPSYIPNSTELLSCEYDGYINKLRCHVLLQRL